MKSIIIRFGGRFREEENDIVKLLLIFCLIRIRYFFLFLDFSVFFEVRQKDILGRDIIRRFLIRKDSEFFRFCSKQMRQIFRDLYGEILVDILKRRGLVVQNRDLLMLQASLGYMFCKFQFFYSLGNVGLEDEDEKIGLVYGKIVLR